MEDQIEQWRSYLVHRDAIAPADVDELEGHLRDQIDGLEASGLSPDEAFLVAVTRMGRLDDLSREFAREHSDRLWKQLVVGDDAAARTAAERPRPRRRRSRSRAALAVKVPALFGIAVRQRPDVLRRSISPS